MKERKSGSGWPEILTDLKRRRVFRAAAVYAASAFVVLEAADLAVEPLGLPSRFMTFLWVVALAGFGVVVVLAWAFDLVPDEGGTIGDGNDDSPEDGASPGRARSRAARVGFAVIATLSIVGAAVFGARRLHDALTADVTFDSIAVFPFHVRSSEALGYLREGMVDLLSRNLDGAGGLRSVDPVRVIELTTDAASDVVSAESGGEMARRIGAGQYVVGSVNAVAGTVRIHASLYALGDSIRALGTSEVEGDTTELFTLVDELTAELLAGQPLGPASQPLARSAAVTSRSLPALKAYLEGERLLRDAEFDEAIGRLAEAIEHDSTFALAYYRKAVAHRFAYQLAESRREVTRALEHGGQMGRHDRLLAEAFAVMADGDLAAARERYRAILREYPEDLEAKVHLATLLIELNPREARPLTEARTVLEEVLEVDPKFRCILCDLYYLAAVEQDWPAWERHALALAAQNGDSTLMVGEQLVLAAAHRREGMVDSLASVADTITDHAERHHGLHTAAHMLVWPLHRPRMARRFFELSAPVENADGLFNSLLVGAEQGIGRRRQAYDRIEAAWAADAPRSVPESRVFDGLVHAEPEAILPDSLLRLALRRLERWDLAAAAAGADSAMARAAPLQVLQRYYTGMTASRAGDVATAAEAVAAIDSSGLTDPVDLRISRTLAAILRAELAYRAGEPRDILAALERTDHRVPGDRWWVALRSPSVYGDALRIEALIALERYREALQWLEHSDVRLVPGYYGFAQYRLGITHEALGQRQEAALAYSRFLDAWAGADADLQPRLEQARSRLAGVSGEASATR